MRWYSKLPSQNHQRPESTTPDDWQPTSFQMGQSASANRSTYRSVWKFDILASTVQSRNPAELLQDVLWERFHWRHRGDTKRVVAKVVGSCDDALEISFLWKAELHQCAYIFLANVDKSWMNPMNLKWWKFPLSQLGTTATITASMS